MPSLADFRILRPIGQGYSGHVYLASHSSGVKVALKVIKKSQSDNSRILLEQRLQQSLSGSPYFLPLLASWHDSVNFYLVSQYCSGQDIEVHLAMEGRFTEDRARFYAAELLVALEELKNQQILHRDIKPANVLLTSEGHIRLIDFGLATNLKASPAHYEFRVDPNQCAGSFTIHDPDFTSAERVGTPSYMSADQHAGRPYSFEVDLHALGVSIFQMLTGRLPFGEGAQSREEMVEAVLCEHLTFRPEDQISPHASNLLHKLLGRDSKSPAQLEEILQHPWFAGVCWDRVRAQTTTPRKLKLCNLSKSIPTIEIDEGVPCLPDPFPGFTYTSPHFHTLMARRDGGIFNRFSKFFLREQSPSSPPTPSSTSSSSSASSTRVDTTVFLSASPPRTDSIVSSPPASPPTLSKCLSPLASPPAASPSLSPLASTSQVGTTDRQSLSPRLFSPAMSSLSFRMSARMNPPPTPAPTIPLPPLPTDVAPSSKQLQDDPSRARGDLPPLHIRQQLNRRPRQPPRAQPIRGDMTLMPEVTVTPADDDVEETVTDPTPGLRAPLQNVTNCHYLSPSDAERPAFNPVLKPGPRIKLCPPPKRAKRAQKENAPVLAPDQVQPKAKVACTPPTAVFMLPPKSVPLPLVTPANTAPIQTPKKAAAPMQTPKKATVKPKAAAQPPLKAVHSAKPVKSVPLPSAVPPSAPPQTPRRPASKDAGQPSPKTTPHKSATPKVKPAFKVPAKVAESKLGTPSSSVRKRISATKSSSSASTCSADTNDDEVIYPRPLVRADTLIHPALAFADTKEKPADYPRPPDSASRPQTPILSTPLSIAEAFAPPPRSPPGPKTAPKFAAPQYTSAPQACGVLSLASEAFSPAALAGFYGLSTPRVNLDPQNTKQRAGEIFARARASAIRDMCESPYLSARAPSPPITVGPHYAGYLPGPSPTGIISELKRLWIRIEMAVSRAISWFRYRGQPSFERI